MIVKNFKLTCLTSQYLTLTCPHPPSRATLLHLITQRIGKDNYTELLDSAIVNPLFISATKTPHPTATEIEQLFLDFSFTKFYKKQQGEY